MAKNLLVIVLNLYGRGAVLDTHLIIKNQINPPYLKGRNETLNNKRKERNVRYQKRRKRPKLKETYN